MNVLFTASLLPLGQAVTLPDNHGRPFTYTFNESTFNVQRNLARDVKVCVGHDRDLEVGHLELIVNHGDWLRGTFVLPSEIASEVKVGQPVSVGLAVMPSGNPVLREVSLVPKGHVAGAKVTHRYELKPKPVAPRPSTPAPKVTAPVIRRSVVPRITPRDEDEEFRRRLEVYGDNVPFELVLENMKAEIQALKGHRW